MDKMQSSKKISFLQYSLHGGCANAERLVLFEGMKTKG
jgi:hypothetical protein